MLDLHGEDLEVNSLPFFKIPKRVSRASDDDSAFSTKTSHPSKMSLSSTSKTFPSKTYRTYKLITIYIDVDEWKPKELRRSTCKRKAMIM